jgi:DNA-binding MarR family transcriptional regulator
MSAAARRASRKHDESVTRDRTPAGDALSRLAFQVLRLGALLTVAGDAMAAPAGQTSARWQVLAAVEDEPATVATIARALGLARQSVQRIADVLVRDGVAAYEENPSHRRASLLRLTAPGRAALRKIQIAQREWADEIGGRIGAKELARASETLDHVLDVVASRVPDT